MIFFRMFFGCLLQLAPFAFLCFYPFKDHLRFSARKVCVICVISFPLLAAFFAVTCCFLKTMLPPAQILFVSANMVFLFCLIPIDYMNIFNPLTLFLYFALMFTIFIVYFICFRILFLSHQNIKEMQALTQTQHQLEIQTEQYKRILETTENNRKMHHDLRHHILILQSLLDSGETEKASDYLQNYVQILRRYEVTKFCSHIVTNMIVSHYQSLALDKGITFTARINVPDSLMISDFDIAILLGNLLENAIESANHAKDHNRFISLNIICSGKMLAVTVDNGFNGCVNQNKGTYLSTKPHHTGIGLQSIAGIAKKYHGGVQFSHEGAIFHSSVMLSA